MNFNVKKIYIMFVFTILLWNVPNQSLSQNVTTVTGSKESGQNLSIPILQVSPLPKDIEFFSVLPINSAAYPLKEDSVLYDQVHKRICELLIKELCPDILFIRKNTTCYQLKLPFENDQKSDITFTPFKWKNYKVLVVCLARDVGFATYVYFVPDKQDKEIIPLTPQQILLKNVIDLYSQPDTKTKSLNDNSSDDTNTKPSSRGNNGNVPLTRPGGLPVVPRFYSYSGGGCLISPRYLSGAIRPALYIPPNEWFATCKKIDISRREGETRKNILQKMTENRHEKCQNLIQTEHGRVELIRLLESDEGRNEFGGDNFHYREFHKLPFDALRKYYSQYKSTKDENPQVHFGYEDILTRSETNALRKLLQSNNNTIKKYALQLIEISDAKSLLPDLLKLASEKEQVVDIRSTSAPSGPDTKFKPRVYNFSVYFLLGKLGDRRTLKSLEQLHQSDKIAKEVQADIEFAIEDIKQNLAERDRQRQSWLDLRRDVREKKIFVTGGASMIDIDKPDPEPVSVDGYRNWSTTDGLFKTNAKFVALIDVTNDDGKIIDRDVQLLRKDGKKVAIELSGLRSTDREYVRQQLEHLRDWATLDGSLKIKAKLLGKFDKEVILEESDGITTLVQIENLTDKDKEYLKQKTLSPHSKYAF